MIEKHGVDAVMRTIHSCSLEADYAPNYNHKSVMEYLKGLKSSEDELKE